MTLLVAKVEYMEIFS